MRRSCWSVPARSLGGVDPLESTASVRSAVTVTVRFENFITFARTRTAGRMTSEDALCAAALELLLPFSTTAESAAPQAPPHRCPRGELSR